MSPARAADGDGQGELALVLVPGNGEIKELVDPLHPEVGLRLVGQVFLDLRLQTTSGTELVDEVGVREEPDVKDVVGFHGEAVFEPEARDHDLQPLLLRMEAVAIDDLLAELMHVQRARIDDDVRLFPKGDQEVSLALNSLLNGHSLV